MSIETVDFVFLFTVKAFVWEVLLVTAFNFKSYWVVMVHSNACFVELGFSNYSLVGDVPNEMVVCVRVGVEEVHKHSVFAYPAASDKRVREILVAHGIVV